MRFMNMYNFKNFQTSLRCHFINKYVYSIELLIVILSDSSIIKVTKMKSNPNTIHQYQVFLWFGEVQW